MDYAPAAQTRAKHTGSSTAQPEAQGKKAKPSRFERGFAELRAFKQRYGHVDVPRSYQSKSGFKVSEWLSYVRTNAKTGNLGADRRARLEELGIDFEQGSVEIAKSADA